MTKLQKSDIFKLAELSALTLSDSEAESLLIDLQNIISYVDQINTVALTEYHKHSQSTNHTRPDFATPYAGANLVAQAPEHSDSYFIVPKIVDSSKDAQ
jgi:aspartyl/glutamyl-tRNA(Asn/Gln) amidotransferase C subunit